MAVSARPKVNGIVKYENRDIRSFLPDIIEKLRSSDIHALSLVNCRLTDADAEFLATHLRELRHVTSINLSGNYLTAQGKADFIEIIFEGSAVKRDINFQDNKPRMMGTLEIAKMIGQGVKETVAAVLQAQSSSMVDAMKSASGFPEHAEFSVRLEEPQDEQEEVVRSSFAGARVR